MWNRTKRMINSYLDDLIERTSSPDKDVRQITRAEIARLNELEVQTLASVKMFEKELAEVELKMIGVTERERMARERGDLASAESAGRELVQLGAHRDLLRQQIGEARSSAARARQLRNERRQQGESLATETHLTAMRENLAGIHAPFDATDPSGTIDEMRSRLQRPGMSETDAKLAAAEHEYEEAQRRARVDDMLSRYKQTLGGDDSLDVAPRPPQSAPPAPASTPARQADEDPPEQPKTLGRNEGPIRPID
ncbi:MAG: PspA/IM30 family protein [Blastocatellia bacterium]